MFDVAPLVPEARQLALTVAAVYWKHLQSAWIGLLVHGSALKGGLIPGCSDIDFQLYLDGAALDAKGQLPLSISMAIQRDLAGIDPAPFQYIQTYVKSPAVVDAHTVGPIPGAYHLLSGRLPVPEATFEQLLQGARETIEHAAHVPGVVSQELLGYGGGRLQLRVRYLCTDVWPTLYSVLALQSQQPYEMWRLPKMSALNYLPAHTPMGHAIRQFYQSVTTYYSQAYTLENALAACETGVDFLLAVGQWYTGYLQSEQI